MAPRNTPHHLPPSSISALGVVAPPPIQVTSPKFEGSLATLFGFVRDRRIDLLEVPLLPICQAYFAYMMSDTDPNLDEAAAALSALSYLLERKAWALLPSLEPEPEAEDLAELPPPTAYEYKAAVEALRIWHEERSSLFFRAPFLGPTPYELPYTVGDVHAEDLVHALRRVLERAIPADPPQMEKPARSLVVQMGVVLLAISATWKSLDVLVPQNATREDAVFWFLCLLELMRLGQVRARLDLGDVEFARA